MNTKFSFPQLVSLLPLNPLLPVAERPRNAAPPLSSAGLHSARLPRMIGGTAVPLAPLHWEACSSSF